MNAIVEHYIPDRLEDILDNWRRWMCSDIPVEGFPTHSAVLSTGGASKHFDDFCAELDTWLAETANAIINGLPLNESCALHHCYLRAVFRFRDYEASLTKAKDSLRAGLIARNVYL